MNTALAKPTPAEKWEKVASMLRSTIGDERYDAFFGRATMKQTIDGDAILTVLHRSTANHIQNVYLDEIRRIWEETYHEESKLDVSLRNLNGSLKKQEVDTTILERLAAETEVQPVERSEKIIQSACKLYSLEADAFYEDAYAQAFAIYLFSVLTTLEVDEIAEELDIAKQYDFDATDIVEHIADAVRVMIDLDEIDVITATQIKNELGYENELLKKLDALPRQRQPQIREIIKIVSLKYDVPIHLILSVKRRREFVRARQISMYLAKHLTDLSLPVLGKHFDGRDHTTVLHSIRKIEELMSEDRELKNEVDELLRLLTPD